MSPRFLLALCVVTSGTSVVRADPFSSALSGPFTYAYLGAGLGLPFLRDGALGGERSLRTLDALGTTALLSYGLKGLVREERPDGSDHASFPSLHASAAFAVATMQAGYRPREAAYWYVGAALIGGSRIVLRKHHWYDVLAGAALGYGVARLELSAPRGLLISPTGTVDERSQGFAPRQGLSVQPWMGRGYGVIVSGRL